MVRGTLCLVRSEAEITKPIDDVPVLSSAFRFLPFLPHECGSKDSLSLGLIVGPAAQPQVVCGRGPAARERLEVIQLEEAARRAAVAVLADERALIAIPVLYCAPNVRRNGSRALWSMSPRGSRL